MAGLLPLVIARWRHLSWLVLFVVGGIALFHASTFPWSQALMDQTLLTACVLGPLPVALIAYLLRHKLPRTARGVGWSSGAVASLAFTAMVTVDAFQPELAGSMQSFAMPASAERTMAHWTSFWLHLAIGLAGAACCLRGLGTLRSGQSDATRQS